MTASNKILFLANSFGLGPATYALAVINSLRESWDGDLIYAAQDICLDSAKLESKEVINIDQRCSKSIFELIKKVKPKGVISAYNAFAVKAAREASTPVALIDGLSWYWPEISAEYKSADLYFAPDFPGVDQVVSKNNYINKVSPITGPLFERETNTGLVLVNISGVKTPLDKELPVQYLKLLVSALNVFTGSDEILLVGGKQAISFVSGLVNNEKVKCDTLPWFDYLNVLSKADRLLTVPGLCSVIEAFYRNVPTSFLPPTNLSHWHILNVLRKHDAAPLFLDWETLTEVKYPLEKISEPDSGGIFSSLSSSVYDNSKSRNQTHALIGDLISESFDISGQQNFISRLGGKGEEEIAKKICNEWT